MKYTAIIPKGINEPKRQRLLVVCAAAALILTSVLVFQTMRSVRTLESSQQALVSTGSQTSIEKTGGPFAKGDELTHAMAKIAFNRDDGVYLYTATTKESKYVVKGYEPDISPAGEAIAFTVDRDASLKNRTIQLYDLRTHTVREFQSLAKLNSRQPRWSHDGTKIAFDAIIDRRNHVGILDVTTGEWEDITKGLVFNEPMGLYLNSWAFDDKSLLCHDLSAIYEISPTGAVLNRIPINNVVPSGDVASSIRFQFSQDKKLLLFDGARNPENTPIYLFNLADQKLRRVTPETVDGSEPVWLPSQDAIMFSRGRKDASGFVSDLCVMSLDTRKVTTLIKDASSGSYSTR
jgi:Tol biopolymer transport system component